MTHAIAQLRHLYAQMLRGEIGSQPEAAKYLLGPAIEELESESALRSRVEALAGEWDAQREGFADADEEDCCAAVIGTFVRELRALLSPRGGRGGT